MSATVPAPITAKGIVIGIGRAIIDLLRHGFSMFWIAPLVVAIPVLPELVQHIAEIQLGMFESKEAFAALAQDPTRWAFAYWKLAGLALGFFAAARFLWCAAHGGTWYDVRQIAWVRFIGGLVLFFVIGSVRQILELATGIVLPEELDWVLSVVSIPALFLALAGLFGDRQTTVQAMMRYSWPFVLLLVALAAVGFAPLQVLHGWNHDWAFGAHPVLVWALMIFDSLVVGAIAALVGAAMFIGYDRFARFAASR